MSIIHRRTSAPTALRLHSFDDPTLKSTYFLQGTTGFAISGRTLGVLKGHTHLSSRILETLLHGIFQQICRALSSNRSNLGWALSRLSEFVDVLTIGAAAATALMPSRRCRSIETTLASEA